MKKWEKRRISITRLCAVFIGLGTLTLISMASSSNYRFNGVFGLKKLLNKVVPTARAAQVNSPSAGNTLSTEAMQQIAALLAEKESRTPQERKLASQLLQAIRESRGQQMAAGVPLERANVNVSDSGMVLIDIKAAVSETLISEIQQLGGEIIFASQEYGAIRAQVPLSSIETIAGYREVTFIRSATPAKTNRVTDADIIDAFSPGNPARMISPFTLSNTINPGAARHLSFAERAASVRSQLIRALASRAAAPLIGGATSQGDKAHQADTARSQYGFAGEGIRIGVMSDSFNYRGGAAADVAAGDLPGPGNPFGNTTPVTVVQDLPNPNPIITGSDEGRAMVQIVHDLAPKAQLFFASAFISEAGFATNIKRLRDAPNNCDIVIDDVSYSDEGVFQDSIVAQAVNYVTASGGLYFSSAGNEGSVQRSTASVWEGDFVDGGSITIPGNTKTGTVHNFGTVATPVLGDILLSSSGFVYSLDWSDPLGASNNDYDLFVVNTAGTTVKAASTNIQDGTIDPHEEIGATAFTRQTGDRLVIFKSSDASVRALSLNAEGGRLTVFTPGNTHGHSCAADGFGVAAAAASTANTVGGLFTAASRVETFSSDGPRRIFYNPNGTPVTPGNILFATNGGVVRQKPDITAADGVATSGNSLGSGLNPFSGTSAAAPHAGAIAALIKSANPSLTPAQIRNILVTTAIDIETAGIDNATGVGILNASAAIAAVMTQQADLTAGTVTLTEGAFSNGNTVVEPGEYGNIVVQLNNPSLAAAINVNATLQTSTPGVTVIQGSASYGTINAGSSGSNTGTPFVIGLASTVPCGSSINLVLTATLANGSPLVSSFSVNVGNRVAATISSTLNVSPPAGTGYTATSGTKVGTLARNGVQSTCANVKPAPLSGTGFSATAGGRYVAFTFTNPNAASQCVTATVTSGSANNLQTATFNNSGFVAATSLNAGTNYLADPGTRAATMIYSFTVPGGESFTTVIYDATTGGTAGATAYTLTVSLSSCAGGPVCSPVTITNGVIASGAIGVPYTQSFNASGGSGSYGFSLTGGLPAGLTFSGNTISGTPTQAGSFSITITASDAAGCPAGTMGYTLVIAGTIPASLTATAGDGQSTLPGTLFPTALQATVRDGNTNLLSGVAVTFTAPSSGASGTFAGGVSTLTVVTNGSGVATASAFTANTTAGSYAVTATVNNLPPVSFNLTNNCPGNFVVTNNGNSGAGTLRDIITNACAGAVITFDPTVTGTITLTGDELTISKAITITGPGAGVLAISGNHQSRVVNIAAGAGNTVEISGLTIKEGSTKSDGTDFFGGGGVLIQSGTVNLIDSVITANSATNSGNPSGGGVDNEGGVVTITRCAITNNTITNNIASNGAFYLGGGVFNEGTSMTINNSTISGNVCGPFGAGGGIAFFTSMTLTNSTVFGNSANVGGNIFRGGGTLTFKNNIIAGGALTGVGGSGVDISGTSFSSQGFNLIQTTAGGTITGTTGSNITGVSPNLFPLGNYGGPTPSLLPAPNSPVINTGDTGLTMGLDQRSLQRVVGGQADIGAVEANYLLVATAGTPQSAVINTAFGSLLQATVTESGNLINGVTVTYTAPGSGPSGLFGASATATGMTNASGIVNSPTFTANGTTGSYNVTAGIGPAFPTVNFSLTNTGPPATITATAGTPQVTQAGQAFATPLQATVRDSGNVPVSNVSVTFTVVPNNGSGGTFPGNVTQATVTTNINGQATAPTLTANSTGGIFTVNAAVNGVKTPAVFTFTVCGAIVCPANIVKSNDPNQCGAVVTYATPTTLAGCGSVACSPPSGSFFPKGTTTVTCTVSPGGQTCSFTVTVNDTQLPTISCPADITVAVPPQCPFSSTGIVVNYPAPIAADNCPGVVVTYSKASGSLFPVGTTVVTCTATDTSGNKATCTFKVRVFDICLQDDSNANTVLLINSFTGEYLLCFNGQKYTGTGVATKKGCVCTLTTNEPTRRINITVDMSTKKGSGSIQSPPGKVLCTITDRDLSDSSCNCSYPN